MTDTATRAILLQQLGAAISDLSEECWHASWLIGAENTVPHLCHLALKTGQPQPWGQGQISVKDARRLTTLANDAGTWANLDGASDQYIAHDPQR